MGKTRIRGSRLSSRPFYMTVLLLSIFTAYSFLPRLSSRSDVSQGYSGDLHLFRRDEKPECRAVSQASDQCSFIKKYCVDEDAGLLPYLGLYYCGLSDAKPVAFIILVVWLGLLFTTIGIAASDFFSVNLSTIAAILGLSESLAGVTFLAFGNGSPDVFSTFAAMGSNSASMAVGELIGAASFITGVIAGSMALVREFRVDRRTYARDICFFIVAVAFTMVFLADGYLHLWECCVMIAYYITYVVTVVGWHWYTKRRRQRLRREGEARSHVYGLTGQQSDELAGEPYRDEPENVDPLDSGDGSQSQTLITPVNGPRIEVDGQELESGLLDDDISDEDQERMVAAEMASSMRVLRTGPRRGHSTKTPIRPSLVGALEFRSALAQLQRESTHQLSHIPGRSHSDHRLYGREPRGRRGTTDAISAANPARHTVSDLANGVSARDRALSTGHTPVLSSRLSPLTGVQEHAGDSDLLGPPASSGRSTPSPAAPSHTIGGNLAPPPLVQTGEQGDTSSPAPESHGALPSLQLQIPGTRSSSYSDLSSPMSQFPQYTDSPMPLTPRTHHDQADYQFPAVHSRHTSYVDVQIPSEEPRPVSWWPYSIFPPPHILLATLFPTLQGWKDKAYWDRFISAISVPSIFLLVITLPVVESEPNDDDSEADELLDPHSHGDMGQTAVPVSVQPDAIRPEGEWERYRRHTLQRHHSRQSSHGASPLFLSLGDEETVVDTNLPSASPFASRHSVSASKPVSATPSISNANDERRPWNRWLVCVQLFTGPLFAVFILWANMSEEWEEPGKELVKMFLYTLVVSLVLLAILVMSTSEHSRPKYHYLLCFLGFVISIAWISTIAEEVVGVLKAFGVILGISEGLLGLTIFAAGNSVGDLVADITVARLGYPVMALSACFGGPMLNILLGIGIGGVLMMVQTANHRSRKHPDEPMQYGPYRVQVGGTLMISAIALLVILFSLLIVVPLNKWILTRKLGWSLIALWAVSTIVNVIVEVTGAWGDIA